MITNGINLFKLIAKRLKMFLCSKMLTPVSKWCENNLLFSSNTCSARPNDITFIYLLFSKLFIITLPVHGSAVAGLVSWEMFFCGSLTLFVSCLKQEACLSKILRVLMFLFNCGYRIFNISTENPFLEPNLIFYAFLRFFVPFSWFHTKTCRLRLLSTRKYFPYYN